jgi:hypothetical protein
MENDGPGSKQIFGIHELYRPKAGEPDLEYVTISIQFLTSLSHSQLPILLYHHAKI